MGPGICAQLSFVVMPDGVDLARRLVDPTHVTDDEIDRRLERDRRGGSEVVRLERVVRIMKMDPLAGALGGESIASGGGAD